MSRGPQRPRIVLSVNRGANTGRALGLVPRVERYFRESGVDVVTVAADTPAEARTLITDTLTSLADAPGPPPALVVAGGDGAVHTGLQVVAGTEVPLGIVPIGSGNDIARDFGLASATPRAAVTAIAEALEAPWQPARARHGLETATSPTGRRSRGVVRSFDAVHVTGQNGATCWYLSILCAGLDAAVNLRTNAMSWPPGRLRYLRALTEHLRDLRPYGYRLVLDGQQTSAGALLVAVTNTRYFGGGMLMSPQADAADGLLEVITVDPVSLGTLLRVFPRIYRGTHVDHTAVHVRRAREVHLAHDPQAGRRPPQAMADGDPLGELPLTLRAVPGAVRVVTRTLKV